MDTITAISSGEYSDYGINYLCKTEDDARKIMERLGSQYKVSGVMTLIVSSSPSGPTVKQNFWLVLNFGQRIVKASGPSVRLSSNVLP